MQSDLENIDIMLVSHLLEKQYSEFGNSVRRLESPSYDALVDHNSNSHSNSEENEIGGLSEMAKVQERLILVVTKIGCQED